MKTKRFVCLFLCAVILSFTYANAALQVKNVQKTSGDTKVTIERGSDGKSVDVKYDGESDVNYTIMVVSTDGIDKSTGKPTPNSLNHNQDGVIVYMDQNNDKSNGNVDFEVKPDLEALAAKTASLSDGESAANTYTVYLASSNGGMEPIGTFDIDIGEIARRLGDYNNDGNVDAADIAAAVDHFMKGVSLTQEQKDALDVDHSGEVNAVDIAKLTDCFMKGLSLE